MVGPWSRFALPKLSQTSRATKLPNSTLNARFPFAMKARPTALPFSRFGGLRFTVFVRDNSLALLFVHLQWLKNLSFSARISVSQFLHLRWPRLFGFCQRWQLGFRPCIQPPLVVLCSRFRSTGFPPAWAQVLWRGSVAPNRSRYNLAGGGWPYPNLNRASQASSSMNLLNSTK